FLRDTRSSHPSPAALPVPVEPESFSMPADDRLGLDHHEGLAPVRPEANKGYPQAGPIPEAGHAFACCAGERPAGAGVPGSQTGARHVFVASRSTRRAAISARHTWLLTVSAPSRKYNLFNCYGVFSRHTQAGASLAIRNLG